MQRHKFNFVRWALVFLCALMIHGQFCPLALGQNVAAMQSLGFRNTHINFETPPGYVQGFRDYLNYLAGAQIGTQVGPISYVGNYGGVSESASDDDGFTFYRLTDDIDENGIPGAVIILVPGPNGEFILTTMTDFDDLHTFNIGFDQVSNGGLPYSGAVDAINVVWVGGEEEVDDEPLEDWQAAEALRISDWQLTGNERGLPAPMQSMTETRAPPDTLTSDSRPRRKAKRRRPNGLGILYGLRVIEREDAEYMHGTGGIIGSITSETVAENHVMGPAVGLVWIKSYGPWTTKLQGVVSVGFNSGDVEQQNAIGAEMVPGAINRPLFAQPTESSHHDSHDEFSPNGELRVELNLRITESTTFAINWSGIAVENALIAEDRTRFYLPDMGLVDPGSQQLLVHHFFCGIELVR
jgi:hypothetical protein